MMRYQIIIVIPNKNRRKFKHEIKDSVAVLTWF